MQIGSDTDTIDNLVADAIQRARESEQWVMFRYRLRAKAETISQMITPMATTTIARMFSLFNSPTGQPQQRDQVPRFRVLPRQAAGNRKMGLVNDGEGGEDANGEKYGDPVKDGHHYQHTTRTPTHKKAPTGVRQRKIDN